MNVGVHRTLRAARAAALFCLAFSLTGCARRHRTLPLGTTGAGTTRIPIACRMDALTPAERARSRTVREIVAKATSKTTELEAGYSFQLRRDASLFRDASEWITLETRCCPFLTFDLRWLPEDEGAPVLSITGPDGTKDFLSAEMPELPVETR